MLKSKKGLSVVELIVSFVLCILVFIFTIEVVITVEELYVNLGVKTELLNKQSLISKELNERIDPNKIVLMKSCGNNCLTLFYKDNTSEKLQIDKEKNTFSLGNNTYSFAGLGFVDELNITTHETGSYSEGILEVNLVVKNSIFDSGKYNIKSLFQYNINNTVYSASRSDVAEIFLLGPAVSYEFTGTDDLFIEPGWIVYYPDGRVTINSSDVVKDPERANTDGDKYIVYHGIGDADGATATRVIKNYETAKEHIMKLSENYEKSKVYLYNSIVKYVYKGKSEEVNNYISLGNKMFRILALEVQNQYVTDDDGNLVIEDGIPKKEPKYMLKVVDTEFLKDSSNSDKIMYSTLTDNYGDQVSNWFLKECNNGNCIIKKANMNSIANDVWLSSLLNTGTGKTQIVNGTFNVGLVDHSYYPGLWNSTTAIYEYSLVDLYLAEGNDVVFSDNVYPGKWNGNCLTEVCGPNAAILSLTDVLMSSSKCEENAIGTLTGLLCSIDNWLWTNTEEENEDLYLRLITRIAYKNTWLMTSANYLLSSSPEERYRAKGTLFLDADLYIMGNGTLENPYKLYTISK